MKTQNGTTENIAPPDPDQRTAVLIVAGEDTAPERAYESIRTHFAGYYDQIVFLTVGLVDYAVIDDSDFKGSEIGERVKSGAQGAVRACLDRAREAGMEALACVAIGTDPVAEVEKLCMDFSGRCPKAMFFLGKVVFRNPRWYHGLLHSRTPEAIQKRLEQRGLPLAILPFVIPG
jgi:hypothetical protein